MVSFIQLFRPEPKSTIPSLIEISPVIWALLLSEGQTHDMKKLIGAFLKFFFQNVR
jgi:hypothetical protein